MRQPPEEYYCTACGGTNIIAEAYCSWDSVAQMWVFDQVIDEGYDYCTDCEDSAGEFRPITDVKTLAQIAIKKEEANAATVVA